jgi:hypothetical protein
MRTILFFSVLAVLLVALWMVPPRGRAGQVSCVQVMRSVNRHVSRERGRSADLSDVAKSLGTSPSWVEHCLRAYGRRPKRPGLESAEGREGLLEDYEESEFEESGPEDVEEPGARERPVHPEKPRYLQFKPTPTAAFGERRNLEGFER